MFPFTLEGKLYQWKLNGSSRAYTVVTLPFKEAKELFKTNLYEADTSNGEQRQIHTAHCKGLARDMKEDRYTPTALAAGLTEDAVKNLTSIHDGVLINITEPLPLIDGGHRMESLTELEKEGTNVADLPITVVVYLDTRNKENFLNAQKGRPVDKAHMLSLQVDANLMNTKNGPAMKMALDIARLLHANTESPFYKMVRFDSRGIAPLPVSTLCATGASDLATSLVGLAKLTTSLGKDANYAADAIVEAFQLVKTKAPELLQVGRVLTPPPDGTRGSASMWIGLGILLAYRKSLQEPVDTEELLNTVKQNCMKTVSGNFAGPKKRTLMQELAYNYYGNVKSVEFYKDTVPQHVVDVLSYSAFGLTKPKKAKKTVKKRTKKTATATTKSTPVVQSQPQPQPTPSWDTVVETPDGQEVQA